CSSASNVHLNWIDPASDASNYNRSSASQVVCAKPSRKIPKREVTAVRIGAGALNMCGVAPDRTCNARPQRFEIRSDIKCAALYQAIGSRPAVANLDAMDVRVHI